MTTSELPSNELPFLPGVESVASAAHRCGISTAAVHERISKGQLKGFRLLPPPDTRATIAVDSADVDAYLAAQAAAAKKTTRTTRGVAVTSTMTEAEQDETFRTWWASEGPGIVAKLAAKFPERPLSHWVLETWAAHHLPALMAGTLAVAGRFHVVLDDENTPGYNGNRTVSKHLIQKGLARVSRHATKQSLDGQPLKRMWLPRDLAELPASARRHVDLFALPRPFGNGVSFYLPASAPTKHFGNAPVTRIDIAAAYGLGADGAVSDVEVQLYASLRAAGAVE